MEPGCGVVRRHWNRAPSAGGAEFGAYRRRTVPSTDSAIRSCGKLALRRFRSRDAARRTGTTGGRTGILDGCTIACGSQNVAGHADLIGIDPEALPEIARAAEEAIVQSPH